MTEHRSDPSNGDRLRGALHAVAHGAPPASDAWELIAKRAVAGTTSLLKPPNVRVNSKKRRVLALVAGLVAVAGVAAGMILVHRDSPTPVRTTNQQTDQGATGWYVPQPLPKGWTLESVDTIDPSALSPSGQLRGGSGAYGGSFCPCRAATWVRRGTDRAIQANVENNVGPASFDQRLNRDTAWTSQRVRLGTATGEVFTSGRQPTRIIVAARGQETLRLIGNSLDLRLMEQMATRWVSAPQGTFRPGPVPGFRLISTGALSGRESLRFVRVTMKLEGRDGRIFYDLSSPGARHADLTFLRNADGLPGPVFAVLGQAGFFATYPNADIRDGTSPSAAFGDDAVLLRPMLLQALQPTSAQGWEQFVASADRYDRAAIKSRLADLVRQPEIPGATVTTSLGPAPSTTERRPAELRIAPTEPVIGVAPGDSFQVRIEFSNPSDQTVIASFCRYLSASWALYQRGRPVSSQGGRMVDCTGTPEKWPPGRRREQSFNFRATAGNGASARPLASGTYEARVVLVDAKQTIRVSIKVS